MSYPTFSISNLTSSKSSGFVIISKKSPEFIKSSPPKSITLSKISSSLRPAEESRILPFLSKFHATHPDSPRFPPYLEKALLSSDTVLFLLSVITSTRTAVPAGP